MGLCILSLIGPGCGPAWEAVSSAYHRRLSRLQSAIISSSGAPGSSHDDSLDILQTPAEPLPKNPLKALANKNHQARRQAAFNRGKATATAILQPVIDAQQARIAEVQASLELHQRIAASAELALESQATAFRIQIAQLQAERTILIEARDKAKEEAAALRSRLARLDSQPSFSPYLNPLPRIPKRQRTEQP